MAANLTSIIKNFDRAEGTEVEPFAQEALALHTDPTGQHVAWQEAWTEFRAMCEAAGLAHLIPGTVGREAAIRAGLVVPRSRRTAAQKAADDAAAEQAGPRPDRLARDVLVSLLVAAGEVPTHDRVTDVRRFNEAAADGRLVVFDGSWTVVHDDEEEADEEG